MPEKPFSWVPHENLLSFENLWFLKEIEIDGFYKVKVECKILIE
jgi:hypothetical protein